MDSKHAGIQYEPPGAGVSRDSAAVAAGEAEDDTLHDDDMATVPDRDHNPDNGMQAPCALAPDAGPVQPGDVRHAIQLVPNLEDAPERRRASLWMAAGHADGVEAIAAASWLVYRPDGSQLAVVPGTRPGSCDALGRGYGPAGSMFEAAAHTGQVSQAAVEDDALGLLSRCRAGRAALFAGEFALSVEEPCGEYRIVSVARSSGGAIATLTTSIDVLCVSALKIDFGSVDWGVVGAGNRKPVAGDTQFFLSDGAVPTLRNIGNDGMGLKLRFSPMTSDSHHGIVEFDSCFGRSDAAMQCINPIRAGALISFDTAAERVLCANDVGRIDFAVHPTLDLPAGVYRGIVTLIGFHVPGECAGGRHLQ
jgi:hypothetical protein